MCIKQRRRKNCVRKTKKGYPGFHAWSTVLAFLPIMAIIVFVGHKSKVAEIAESKMAVYAQEYQQEASKSTQLEDQNQKLKERILESSKVVVDPDTRKIVLYFINKYFGKDAPQAIKVFTCESGLSPMQHHDNGYDKFGHYLGIDRGVAQLNSVWQARRFAKFYPDVPFEVGTHDIQMNLKVAADLFHEQGWTPWMCAPLVGVK